MIAFTKKTSLGVTDWSGGSPADGWCLRWSVMQFPFIYTGNLKCDGHKCFPKYTVYLTSNFVSSISSVTHFASHKCNFEHWMYGSNVFWEPWSAMQRTADADRCTLTEVFSVILLIRRLSDWRGQLGAMLGSPNRIKGLSCGCNKPIRDVNQAQCRPIQSWEEV